MPPKTPKKGASGTKLKSAGRKGAPIANGSSANPAKEGLPSPSRKRTHTEPSDESVSKKVKEDPSTPTKQISPTAERLPSPPDQPATEVDKATWQGFCEIESDPGYFSVMLREMGVRGVTVRDLIYLSPEFLQMIPQPIYGLILLFRARLVNSENQEPECPVNVWFANQLPAQNSCATLAMLNTLLNCDRVVDLGEHLRQFKEFTTNMTPFNRGEALASWQFVKSIHNSFAKKMDILENDIHLAHKVHKAEQRAKNGISQYTRHASEDSNASTASLENAAHHFIAFVPVDDELWKLDGMDAQPTNMGPVSTKDPDSDDHWLNVTSQKIQAIMAAGGDPDYSIIAIAKAPLARLRDEMCNTIATFKHAKKRIFSLKTDWSSFLPAPAEGVNPAEPLTPTMLGSIGIFEDMLVKATVSADASKGIDAEDFPELLQRCSDLCREQISLREQILMEMVNEEEENERSRERRIDLGPLIKKWCEFLAENGYLEANLHKFMPQEMKRGARSEKKEVGKGKQAVKKG